MFGGLRARGRAANQQLVSFDRMLLLRPFEGAFFRPANLFAARKLVIVAQWLERCRATVMRSSEPVQASSAASEAK